MTISTSMSPSTVSLDPLTKDLVCVVLPTYNEVDNLPALTAALLALPIDNLQVIVVDDASPDGTGLAADRLASHHPDRVHVLHRKAARGLGRSYVDGFRLALQLGALHIVQMDADFSHNPADVPRLLAASDGADLVIGSRYIEGGVLDNNWSWWRRLLSWWANNVWTQMFLGTKVHDATAGFRCWRRATLEGIGLDRITSNGYVFQIETSYMAERLGYRIIEVPIFFEERRVGHSKMTPQVKIEATWRTVALRWRHRNLARDGRMRMASVGPDARYESSADPVA